MLNFNHLYYFYVFVTEGSVVKAAKKLSISQPALSTQLRLFESHLDEKLFVRVGRMLEITEQGKLVYGYARQMFALGDELLETVKQKELGARAAIIPIGVSVQVGASVVTRMVAPLYSKKEGSEKSPSFRFVAGEHDELLDQLRSRMIDIAVLNHPVFQEDFETLLELKFPVRIAGPPAFERRFKSFKGGENLLEKNVLGLIKLFKVRFVLPAAGSRLREETDRFFEQAKTSPQSVLEADSLVSLAEAVRSQIGIGFLPQFESRDIQYYGPAKGYWQHTLYFYCRRGDGGREQLAQLARACRSGR